MEIVSSQKQITDDEKSQVNLQVKTELVEHLYRGCLPGTVGGIPVGIAFILNFYGHTSPHLLIAWSIYYFLALFNLGALYFVYKKNKDKFPLNNWLVAYSISMSLCAIAWGTSTLLIPTDSMVRQYVAIIALLIFANSYAAGTIGVFELCVATLVIIMMPMVIWFLFHTGSLYKLMSVFTAIYFVFLLSINHRSTQWFKDSLKLKLENMLVSYQANHDLLTDLPNQRLLTQYIDTAIGSVKDSQHTFALVTFSLNRMEIIYDSMGHQAGDSIIKIVAERLTTLSEAFAKEKNPTQYIITISRKDSFSILLAPLAFKDAEEKVRKLFDILEEPVYIQEQGVKMTASIGVSLFGQDGKDANSLMVAADAAMLQAKQAGGNRMEFYRTEINEQLPKQLELENELHTAVEKDQLVLYYQPLIDLKTNQICGMEALIRWQHPTLGFISPARFIPLAEETGLIVPIGEWVMHEACRQTQVWHQMGYKKLKVAVNLAEKQLRQKNLIEMIQRILQSTKFDPHSLELEITETAILNESVTSTIKEFKSLGLGLAVDDFGTGYSGLSYLKRFSIDKLKVDQSFIRDIPDNNNSMTIVSAIIAMAKELHVNTLAEGVETEPQLEFLRAKGCDFIQGYYFSKPLSVPDFTAYLAKTMPVVQS